MAGFPANNAGFNAWQAASRTPIPGCQQRASSQPTNPDHGRGNITAAAVRRQYSAWTESRCGCVHIGVGLGDACRADDGLAGPGGPEAARTAERAVQRGALPVLGNIPGARAVVQYTKLVLTPAPRSDDCSVMTPIGPHDPPSTVHMQTAKLQQVMVQTFLTAGTSVTEAISASHVKQFVRAMRNRSAAAEVSTAAEVSEASAAAEASTATSLPTPTVIPLVVRDGRRTKGMQPSTAWTLCGGWSDAQIGPPSNDELPQCQLVCIPTSTTRVPGQK